MEALLLSGSQPAWLWQIGKESASPQDLHDDIGLRTAILHIYEILMERRP
jgi:hypothetical protein